MLALQIEERKHRSVFLRKQTALLCVVACLSTLLARSIAYAWLDDIPHVMDEITYDLQARTYALGHVSGPEVQPLAAFNQWFVEDREQRFGIFPPGWPLVLSLGHRIGLATWINPLLHGLTVLGIGLLGRRLRSFSVGLTAAIVYGLCPQALLLAASRMSHTWTALLALVALGIVMCWSFAPEEAHDEEEPRSPWPEAVIVGVALAWLAATRPLCALVVGVCVGLGAIIGIARGRARPEHLFVIVGAIMPLAILGLYNRTLTGHAWVFPQTHYFDTHLPPLDLPFFTYRPGCNALGFGAGHGCELTGRDAGHSVREGIESSLTNLRVSLVLAWGGGALLLAALYALRVRGARALAAFLLVPTVVVVLAYAAYWYVGTCYGARFYHTALPFFVLAAALGLTELHAHGERGARAAKGLGIVAALFFVFATTRVEAEVNGAYWGTDARFVRYAERYRGPKAVVLVAFETTGVRRPAYFYTGAPIPFWSNGVRILSAQLVNKPMLDGPLIFGRYHPALVPEIRSAFPKRTILVYVFANDSARDRVVPLADFHPQAADETTEMPPVNFEGAAYGTARSP